MLILLDANHLCHLLWHMGCSKQRKLTGDQDATPDLDDVLDWFQIRLDNLRSYFLASGVELESKGYDLGMMSFIACFDSTKRSFRKDLFAEYKANRTRSVDVGGVVSAALGCLENSDEWEGLQSPDGFEADDLIASLAAQAEGHVIIHSPDKDFNQCLVEGRVGIVKRSGVEDPIVNDHGLPIGGEFVAKHYTERKFANEFRFPVDRWVDYQCLVGDSADNVPGAKWVGHVTAQHILTGFPEHAIEEITPEALPLNNRQLKEWDNFLKRLDLLRELFTLRTDLELKR